MNAHSIEIAAFQSKNSEKGGHDRVDVPLEIVPKTEPGMVELLNRKLQTRLRDPSGRGCKFTQPSLFISA